MKKGLMLLVSLVLLIGSSLMASEKQETSPVKDKAKCEMGKAKCDMDKAKCDKDKAKCEMDKAKCEKDKAACKIACTTASGEMKACPPDCTKPCCAEKAKKDCAADCTKPCCAKEKE